MPEKAGVKVSMNTAADVIQWRAHTALRLAYLYRNYYFYRCGNYSVSAVGWVSASIGPVFCIYQACKCAGISGNFVQLWEGKERLIQSAWLHRLTVCT